MDRSSRPVSTYILLFISPFITMFSWTIFNLSSVHNTFDFLVPTLGLAQLVFIYGVFKGKFWALLGFSMLVLGLMVATVLVYFSKGEPTSAYRTLGAISPLLLLMIYYWTIKRNYFD